MGYQHFNIDEREVILKMRAQQASLDEIGRRLNRPKGTISRNCVGISVPQVIISRIWLSGTMSKDVRNPRNPIVWKGIHRCEAMFKPS